MHNKKTSIFLSASFFSYVMLDGFLINVISQTILYRELTLYFAKCLKKEM